MTRLDPSAEMTGEIILLRIDRRKVGGRVDLRIDDEGRYIEAAVIVAQCNAQPYSRHDWHWRILCAHSFGQGACPLDPR